MLFRAAKWRHRGPNNDSEEARQIVHRGHVRRGQESDRPQHFGRFRFRRSR